MLTRVRLIVFAALGGGITGVASYWFLEALIWATRTRVEHPWLVWLLPGIGVLVAGVYFYWGGRAKGGTPAVIEQGNVYTHGVGPEMAPLIFGGSIAGHLGGASVGREGAALQMAGSITDTVAGLGRFSRDDRRTLVAASLAGGWGSVFGVPFTGVAFALQVTHHRRWRVLIPALASAWTGKLVVSALDADFGVRPHLDRPDWTLWTPFALALAGIGFGLMGRLFVLSIMAIRNRMGHRVRWPPVRAFIGGLATLALMALAGRDYLGLSLPLLGEALAGEPVDWWVPFLKLLFTAIALGTGFVGGEVAPLFVIGGTLGASMGSPLHTDRAMLAAVGSTTTFAAAASVALTGIVLSVEQFGRHALVPALIVAVTARMAAGRPGLYVHH